MATRSQVLSDIALLRQSLRRAGSPHLPLLKLQGWRPAFDVAVDLTAIVAALLLALKEPWAWPITLLVLGNRQRALGNILHDAAHRNLTRNRVLNDLVTRALIAPLLFVSLSHYRELHFRHHLDLGGQGADPDLIPIPAQKASSWVAAVAANMLSLRAILGSTFGHLLDPPLRPQGGCTSSGGGPCFLRCSSWLRGSGRPPRSSPSGWPHVLRRSTRSRPSARCATTTGCPPAASSASRATSRRSDRGPCCSIPGTMPTT